MFLAFDPSSLYSFLKWAAPIIGITGFLLTIRKDILKRADDWANTLLNNHLQHIQAATAEAVKETRMTNELLVASALRETAVKDTLMSHHERQQNIWSSILSTLTILEDRTRRQSTKPSPSRKRKRK